MRASLERFLYRHLFWHGRVLYVPPLRRESVLAVRITVIVSGAALVWWMSMAHPPPGFFLVPLLLAALGPLLYARSWALWDLLVWDSNQPWHTPPSEQDANYDAAVEAVQALGRREPAAVREALAKTVNPDPWRRMINLYYGALADLMEGQQPNAAQLRDQLDDLDPGPRRDSAEVMIALVAAGCVNLSGGDWRAPLLACRRQLGLRLSPRRVLWPMRVAFVVVILLTLFSVALVGPCRPG
jgi:hypothetical protein